MVLVLEVSVQPNDVGVGQGIVNLQLLGELFHHTVFLNRRLEDLLQRK